MLPLWGGPAETVIVAGAHRELSVALVRYQGAVLRSCTNLMARAAGWEVLLGADMPYVES